MSVIAVICAGIVGCFATGLVLKLTTGRPASVVTANWRKHVWSILFAVPLLFVLKLPGDRNLNAVLAVVVLAVMPSIASKFYFGPKDASWLQLLKLHGAYAIAAFLTFMIVAHIPLLFLP